MIYIYIYVRHSVLVIVIVMSIYIYICILERTGTEWSSYRDVHQPTFGVI